MFLVLSALLAGASAAQLTMLYPSLFPSTDPSLVLMAGISQQLESYAINSAFVNSTQPPISLAQATGAATPAFDASYYIGLLAACCAFIAFISSLAVLWLCITSYLLWVSMGDQRSQQRWYTRSRPYHSIAWPYMEVFRTFFNVTIPLAALISVSSLAISLHLFMIGLAVQFFQQTASFIIIVLCIFLSATPFTWMVYRVIVVNIHTVLMRELHYNENHLGFQIGHLLTDATRVRYRHWAATESFRDAVKAAILLAAFFSANGEGILRTSGRVFFRELPAWLMIKLCRQAWLRCRKDLLDYHGPSISTKLPLALHYLDLEILETIEVFRLEVQSPEPATHHPSSAPSNFFPLLVLLGGYVPYIGTPSMFSAMFSLKSYKSEVHDTEPAIRAKQVTSLLRRTLQIGPVWPHTQQIDPLFFPLMATYATRGEPYGRLALAILQLSLELPQLEQYGFPSGSVEVMKALNAVAFDQCVQEASSTDGLKTFFVCCRLALNVLSASRKCPDVLGDLLDQAESMYKSLEFTLVAPLWRQRQWARDPAALQECGKILVVLKNKSKPPGSPTASLITPSLLDAFRGLCTAMAEDGLTNSTPYLDWHAFVMDIVGELEDISATRQAASLSTSHSSTLATLVAST
ncbi:hypothetical protein BD311DRAFT_787620 [Dichomitus squalens]|uniref:Uncharacterized protein n=1 Tax=Dichomitus squalens TaxID=114155 RepID=A0A4V2K0R7_9APHY|nr:hypothetical protein BD311DRAFT_787620 [Dichomitus squalens]